jgi:hypothetical protein
MRRMQSIKGKWRSERTKWNIQKLIEALQALDVKINADVENCGVAKLYTLGHLKC